MQILKSTARVLILICCFLPASRLPAENVSAEIININQDQKVVFADLGRDVLAVGDVMSLDGADHPIYMEVEEVSDAVSKLRISRNERFYSNVSELDNVSIGMKLTRVWTCVNQPSSTVSNTVPTSTPLAAVKNVPVLDPQVFVKPDLSKESIQSIIDRMNTLVDGNIKLSNALAQCQSDLGDSQKLSDSNEGLKKQIDDLSSKFTGALLERDKYKKQSEELLAKINQLKNRLDHLNSIIGERS